MSPVDIDPDWIVQSLAEPAHGLESDVWRAVDTLAELLVLEPILARRPLRRRVRPAGLGASGPARAGNLGHQDQSPAADLELRT